MKHRFLILSFFFLSFFYFSPFCWSFLPFPLLHRPWSTTSATLLHLPAAQHCYHATQNRQFSAPLVHNRVRVTVSFRSFDAREWVLQIINSLLYSNLNSYDPLRSLLFALRQSHSSETIHSIHSILTSHIATISYFRFPISFLSPFSLFPVPHLNETDLDESSHGEEIHSFSHF